MPSARALRVIAAFEQARADELGDKIAHAAALRAAPELRPHQVAQMLKEHLGVEWKNPSTWDALGHKTEARCCYAMADLDSRKIYLGVTTADKIRKRWSEHKSGARNALRGYSNGSSGAEWIASVWDAGGTVSLLLLEESEVFIPNAKRQQHTFRALGPGGTPCMSLEYVWAYVAMNAGFTLAADKWAASIIPFDKLDRSGAKEMVYARQWPEHPIILDQADLVSAMGTSRLIDTASATIPWPRA